MMQLRPRRLPPRGLLAQKRSSTSNELTTALTWSAILRHRRSLDPVTSV